MALIVCRGAAAVNVKVDRKRKGAEAEKQRDAGDERRKIEYRARLLTLIPEHTVAGAFVLNTRIGRIRVSGETHSYGRKIG